MEVSAAPPPQTKIFNPPLSAAASPNSSGSDIHPDLAAYCAEIEAWAISNRNDSRWDALRYFALKAPAVASSGLAAVFAAQHWTTWAAWLAAAASVCTLADALNPSGQLRNAHLRAFHQLRELESRIVNDWRIGKLSGKDHDAVAATVLGSAQKERDKISRDLQAAETSLSRRSAKD